MYYKRHAGVAQLVEHNLAKVGVASSSLVSRSRLVLKVLVKLLIHAGIAQLVGITLPGWGREFESRFPL